MALTLGAWQIVNTNSNLNSCVSQCQGHIVKRQVQGQMLLAQNCKGKGMLDCGQCQGHSPSHIRQAQHTSVLPPDQCTIICLYVNKHGSKNKHQCGFSLTPRHYSVQAFQEGCPDDALAYTGCIGSPPPPPNVQDFTEVFLKACGSSARTEKPWSTVLTLRYKAGCPSSP